MDAIKVSRVLGITLTSRGGVGDGKKVEMCGIPHHAVDSYLERLIKNGVLVAICEQLESPEQAKKNKRIINRQVTRLYAYMY